MTLLVLQVHLHSFGQDGITLKWRWGQRPIRMRVTVRNELIFVIALGRVESLFHIALVSGLVNILGLVKASFIVVLVERSGLVILGFRWRLVLNQKLGVGSFVNR